jgi:phenylacetate-CoA ligase
MREDRSLIWRARRRVYRYGLYYPTVFLRGQWVPQYLGSLCRSQFEAPRVLQAHQDELLARLGEWLREHVAFYEHMSGPLSRETITQLPVITRRTLVEHREQLRARSFNGRRFVRTTGGSTGQPVTVDKDARAFAWDLAATWRGHQWAGVSIGDPQGRLWGVPATPAGRRYAWWADALLHRRRCSAFQFTVADMERYTELLNHFQPSYLYGYVSMLVEYARHLQSSGVAPRYRLRSVIATSEVLEPQLRAVLENAFACPVFNEYGCGEVGRVAHECEHGSMHLNSEKLFVEVQRPDGTVATEGEGMLLVTDLLNRAMPLIRYQIGDVAKLGTATCACGRGLPVLEKVFGRAYDMITGPGDRKFHGQFFVYMIEQANRLRLGIDAFQVIQSGLNELTLKIVPGRGYGSATEAFVRSYLRERFHPDVQLSLRAVDHIERERSGKMRLVVGLRSVV